MSWIRDIFISNSSSTNENEATTEERFPRDTYGPGYPIVVDRDELNDLNRLIEIERSAADGWENLPLTSREEFDEIVEEVTGQTPRSPEKYRNEIQDIVGLWEEQLTHSRDAVWITVGTDTRFKLYIAQCEHRAETDDDSFEEPPELDTARTILERIETVQEVDSKLVIVHRDDLPLDQTEGDD
ncbi:hypothetical protein DJ73_02095 [Halorubrum sp. Ea1]|uniref:hypothetical protein n=1 Tax=Halorubrum sp. Ea1 TaxID=1480718 RepID=UPI000B997BAD|nr:hypothetical protein [Halorubrum sp. Ea1]OYR55515.1 hypothetical protein DJ73_02095 [Halorubrum sp. Ea1]